MFQIKTTKTKLMAAMITMVIVIVATFTVKNYQQETVLSNIVISLAFVLVYSTLLYFIIEKLVNRPIKKSYDTVREMVLKGDLTQRIPMQKVDCSALRKCKHTDCPLFA